MTSIKCQKDKRMFKNKAKNNTNNVCGRNIYELRTRAEPRLSQRMLAEKLQLHGIDVDKNAVQRIESGKRFVTDVELKALSQIFNVTCDDLLKED